MSKKNKNLIEKFPEDKLIMWFKIIIVAFTLLFYYNVTFNYFSMDDFYVNIDDPYTVKGFAGIPEIFTSLYSDNNMSFGYRPIVKLTYAIEYQFTADTSYNPYISHFINILLYILALLILYKLLRRLLRNYNPWFPFFVVLLFMAHPTHTEVVASLKNRDILLSFIFSFTAVLMFVKWADSDKVKFLIFGVISYLFALMSKESAITQLAVFPLVLYFFTDVKPKKIIWVTAISLFLVIGFFLFRMTILPETNREMSRLFENPLIRVDNIFIRLSTCLYVMGFYIKQMFVPFPLLYYYGFDMIPVVGWTNPWVLLSLAVYIALLIIAIKGLKSKNLISFIILFFFIDLSMYSNVIKLVQGIVADRFLFFMTFSFSIFVIWLLFKIFKIPTERTERKQPKLVWVSVFLIMLLIPYGYYVHKRNAQWKTQYTLYNADMPRLWNSVKANNLYAHEIMKKVNNELAKPVNPYKFILKAIDKADKHYRQAVALDSTYSIPWNNLGIMYSKIHGNQALLRVSSYMNRNELEKAAMEEKNAEKYFNEAIRFFHNAIKYDPEYGSAYFNLANTYELQQKYDSSIYYFQKAVDVDGSKLVSMSRLANAYFMNDQPDEAIEQNLKMIDKYPESDMPYINLGNYSIRLGDTIAAVSYFEKAFSLTKNPDVGKFMSQYYQFVGDSEKASYYMINSNKKGKKE